MGREVGGGVQDGEHMYIHGRFKSMYGKTNTILQCKINKLIPKKFRLVVVVVLVTSVISSSLHPLNCSPPGSSVHGDSPGKNTGVGCHSVQGIFLTQG